MYEFWITFYWSLLLRVAWFLGWMSLFVFFGLPIVSCSMINSLILGCLWPMIFVLNNIFILGIWRSAISHLPECFCPWTSFHNIRFNIVPSDPFMSHLSTQLEYSAEEFQALQLIALAVFGVVDQPLAPCMLVHLLESTFKQLGCRFDIMDSISSIFLCFLTYAIVYVLKHHIIFQLYLYFLNNVLYFLGTPVLTVP